MRFGILGPLEVHDGRGRTVALRHPAERRLLVRLLVADGEPVPVHRLAADLADDLEGAGVPVSRLFDRILTLRRRLEPGRAPGTPARVIVTTAAGYAVPDAGPGRDDRAAAGLVAGARAALAAGRLEVAGRQAAEALALWRGRALADAGDASWASAERRRLAALEDRARLVAATALAVDRPDQAGPALDEAQGLRPHDGGLWALRAAVELALERDVEALRALRRARIAIEATGRDRGPILRAMEAAVLRVDHHEARALCLRIALDGAIDEALPESLDGALDGVGPDLESSAVTGDVVGQQIRWLPGRSRRLVALLATIEQIAAGEAPAAGVEPALLARAAGLTPMLVAEHLDPAVAMGLVAALSDAGGVRLRHRRAAPAVLAGLTPFERRCLRRLVGQATGAAEGAAVTAR